MKKNRNPANPAMEEIRPGVYQRKTPLRISDEAIIDAAKRCGLSQEETDKILKTAPREVK